MRRFMVRHDTDSTGRRTSAPERLRADGAFMRDEAELLAVTLNAGELPVGLTLVSESGSE